MAAARERRTEPVTRHRILAVALTIVDSEGLDALSMRRIARELGVEAMSLYHHVANKDAILDGLADTVLREMRFPDPLPGDWVELLVAMVDAFRAALCAHPRLLPALITRPLTPPEDAMVTPVSVLQAQGFDPERMLALYQSLMALTFGHAMVSSNAANASVTPPMAGEDFRRAARFLIEGFAADPSARRPEAGA